MSTAVLPSRQLLEALEHLELRARVERRRRLVEDQQLRVAHVRARDGDLLPFAARQVDAGLEALAEHLVVARRAACAITSSARLRWAAATMRARSLARLDAADRDVVGGGEVVAHEILEDDADVRAEREEVVLAQVVAVEQDAALVGVVEAREQLHERRLAGAVLADQRERLARAQLERQPAHRPALRARDSGSRRSRTRTRCGSAPETAADSAAGRSRAGSRRTRRGRRDRAPGPPTCEKPISRFSSRLRSRRNEPARNVRSPIVKSPCSVRHTMYA